MAKKQTLLEEIEHDVLTSQPLADTLRKCVVLGGRAGSVELREWATRELRGYHSKDDVPDYRTVGAPILADVVTGGGILRGRQIGVLSLPDGVRQNVSEQFTLREGVGTLEAMAVSADNSEHGALRMSLPMASEIGSVMDQEIGDPYQQFTALYWSISGVLIHGVVDQVRTTLAELVAEMRAGTPSSSDLPAADVANQAVSVAVQGKGNRVTVLSAHESVGAPVNLKLDDDRDDSPFWTKTRRVAAFVAALVTITFAAVQVFGWI
ncbi:MAG: hypothetical protein F4Z58_11195 [Acidimicrobiaceae bacterium]|nr:hypothetical protein [Acidimicrobiaceae bacterium]MYD08328.1 hypothetical protein [Acidimicrobiaceae bacterium]MYI58651.1 hypothetical protein [Acidimicrobiaceae bacterium]